MQFDRKISPWGVLALAALFGALIWALSPGISGRAEPWDADSAYYLLALPVAGLVGGLLAGGPLWAHYTGLVAGQFLYGLIFTGAGSLMLLGLAFLAVYALLYLAGVLGGLRMRRGMAAREGSQRRHLRLVPGPEGGQFLERYDGQSTEQLLALQVTHRIDSLVLAFEEALQAQSAIRPLAREEEHVVTLGAFEREMSLGGYQQFLRNASNAMVHSIVEALQAIDCPKAAVLTQEAIDIVGAGPLRDPHSTELRLREVDVRRRLLECDAIYASNDEVPSERLFRYIEARPESFLPAGVRRPS